MSLEINWDVLSSDTQLNDQIREFLDDQLQKVTLPNFIKDVKVTKFYIGEKPPAVTIRHIGDPLAEFYESDEEDEDTPDQSESLSIASRRKVSEKDKEKDVQLTAELDYSGDMVIEVATNLLLNYPSTSFIELPIKLRVTGIRIHSMVVIAYVRHLVNLLFLCDVEEARTPTSPVRHNSNPMVLSRARNERIEIIQDMKIESEIGGGTKGNQSYGSVLKNVGKVEKFLVENFRSILREELAWPGWISFDFRD